MADSINAYRLREMERRLEDLAVPPSEPGEDPMIAIVGAALSTKTGPLFHYLALALDRIDALERRLAAVETKSQKWWRP